NALGSDEPKVVLVAEPLEIDSERPPDQPSEDEDTEDEADDAAEADGPRNDEGDDERRHDAGDRGKNDLRDDEHPVPAALEEDGLPVLEFEGRCHCSGGDSADRGAADAAGVLGEDTVLVARLRRLPALPTGGHLRLIDFEVEATGGDIDRDDVAFPDERDR